jgi:hypothetical protein
MVSAQGKMFATTRGRQKIALNPANTVVRDAPGVPLPAARGGDASCVERLCYLSERACARLLSFANDGQHVGSVPISFGLHRLHGILACRMEAWVAIAGQVGVPLGTVLSQGKCDIRRGLCQIEEDDSFNAQVSVLERSS